MGFSFHRLYQNGRFRLCHNTSLEIYEFNRSIDRDFDPMSDANYATNYLVSEEMVSAQFKILEKGSKHLHFRSRLDSTVLTSDGVISDLFNIEFKQYNSQTRNKEMIKALQNFNRELDEAQNHNFAQEDHESSSGSGAAGNGAADGNSSHHMLEPDRYPFLNRIGCLTDKALVGFFPVIANQLLKLLNCTVIEETVILITKVLVRLVHRINNLLDKPSITEHYVEKIFKIDSYTESPQFRELYRVSKNS